MSVVKSYTCSKCGAVLNFDSDREFFDCPFCGSKFNSGAFHSDELFSQAKAGLEQKAYELAKEKYQLILADDPHNFDALLGIVLCEAGVASVDGMEDPDNLQKADLDKVREAAGRAMNNSTVSEARFFELLSELAGKADEIKKVKNVEREIDSGTTGKRFEASAQVVKVSNDQIDSHNTFFGILAAILLIGGVFSGIIGILSDNDLLKVIAAFMLVGLVFVVSRLILWNKAVGDLVTPIRMVDEVGRNAKRNASREAEREMENYKKIYSQLTHSYPERKEPSGPAAEPVKAEDEDLVHSVDPGKKIVCDKCGAELFLDKSGRVYRCDHCGVAYGVSLFFGLSLEKALSTLNAGYFAEADSRLSHVLMQTPSDFDACLGRILCCGRWTKISDIDYTRNVTIDLIRKLESLTKDAQERVSESDREFFFKMKELINILSTLMINKNKQNKLTVQMDEHEAVRKAYSYSYQYVKTNIENAKRQTDYDLRTLKLSEEKIYRRFETLKNELIGMRSDSVFCK